VFLNEEEAAEAPPAMAREDPNPASPIGLCVFEDPQVVVVLFAFAVWFAGSTCGLLLLSPPRCAPAYDCWASPEAVAGKKWAICFWWDSVLEQCKSPLVLKHVSVCDVTEHSR
jgi:hypothetical protein